MSQTALLLSVWTSASPVFPTCAQNPEDKTGAWSPFMPLRSVRGPADVGTRCWFVEEQLVIQITEAAWHELCSHRSLNTPRCTGFLHPEPDLLRACLVEMG